MSVVLADKTPLVFAFDELQYLCTKHSAKMAFSATVCGGLPVINVLSRDLKLVTVRRIRGIFNATSNFVLRELENGGSLSEAITEAQRLGAAEANPSHDLDGHDTANKLFIIMKSFASFSGTIADISTEGIQGIDRTMLSEAHSRGNIIKLVAEAQPHGDLWNLSVKPVELPRYSFLGSCDGWEMGFEIETDLYERICMKNYEADPLGTCAAVMRDCIALSSGF
jgi:homoserine dehydrogenase